MRNRSRDRTAITVPPLAPRRERRITRWLAAGAFLFVFALAVYHGSQEELAPPPAAGPLVGDCEVVQSMTLSSDMLGRVVAREISEVRSQVTGAIRQRFFEEGTAVSKGQLLYLIEDAPYQAAVVAAEGRLAEASVMLQSARSKLKRYKLLPLESQANDQEMEIARDAYLRAEAAVRTRQGALDSSLANLEFTRVRALIAGRIGPSFETVGALVQVGQSRPMALIRRTEDVCVEVSQSAEIFLKLRANLTRTGSEKTVGQMAASMRLVLPDGLDYTEVGTVRLEETVVDPITGAYIVRARFSNVDDTLLPGMIVRAILIGTVFQEKFLSHSEREGEHSAVSA